MKQKNIKGFTLIEMLVVVLIIGILAAIALPQYKQAVLKARLMQMIVYMDALKKSQELYFISTGTYTKDVTKLDIDITGNTIKLGTSEKIASDQTVSAFFHDGTECTVLEHAVACINDNFYLMRKNNYTTKPQVASWPKGTTCWGYNASAIKVCKDMSDGEPEPVFSTEQLPVYIIAK